MPVQTLRGPVAQCRPLTYNLARSSRPKPPSRRCATRAHPAARRTKYREEKMKVRREEPLYLRVHEGTAWKLAQIGQMLQQGAVGIIQTDTNPAFVCDLHNREAVDRLYRAKEADPKKPLSILCRDMKDIAQYTVGFPQSPEFNAFKAARAALPGPYTFILQASKEMPRQVMDSASRKRANRKTVGVRIPDDPIVTGVLESFGGVLLCSSVPVDNEDEVDYAAFCEDSHDIDFIVSHDNAQSVQSTVVDLTTRLPQIIRYGAGDPEPFDFGGDGGDELDFADELHVDTKFMDHVKGMNKTRDVRYWAAST
ncbi:unnamed protein product [Pedinophyceae sp. YPF-701]|nr:unnamed protein product [Pedinophyceae sp. YPF-701]